VHAIDDHREAMMPVRPRVSTFRSAATIAYYILDTRNRATDECR
jgi:hypothetical protein